MFLNYKSKTLVSGLKLELKTVPDDDCGDVSEGNHLFHMVIFANFCILDLTDKNT